MFIEPGVSTNRAPAERNVSGNGIHNGLRFAPLERGGIFGARAFYKHYVPPGRGNWPRKRSWWKNKKLDVCYTELLTEIRLSDQL